MEVLTGFGLFLLSYLSFAFSLLFSVLLALVIKKLVKLSCQVKIKIMEEVLKMTEVSNPGYYPGRGGFGIFFLVILILLLFPGFFGGYGY
jgi:hypothetical protein